MAGRHYGGREGWRGRDSSIFPDDEDDYRSRGSGEPRSFIDRAGDEVRSWFGDDEAERRRLGDMNRADARAAFSRDDFEPRGDSFGPRGQSFEARDQGDDAYLLRHPVSGAGRRRETTRWPRDRGQSDDAWLGRGAERAQSDDNYLRWRAQQIAQLDREYAEYCRERQTRFDDEFARWRDSRLTEGGTGPARGEVAPGASAPAAAPAETTATAPANRSRGSRTAE